jgi:sugar/nucleoside kinase (ribokinase family)
MSGANILVTGYASFDSFILIDHFCGEGKTSTVLAFEGLERPLPGGCACNIAVACARLGIRTALVTVLGADEYGTAYKEFLTKLGVDTSLVSLQKGLPSPRTFLINDRAGNHITLYYPGASDMVMQALKSKISIIQELNISHGVITVGDPWLTREVVFYLEKKGVPILWSFKGDMRAYPPDLLQYLLNVSAYLVINESEAILLKQLVGLGDVSELLKRGFQGMIVTKGDKGSEVLTEAGKEVIPAVRPSCTVDPTGAGDGFVAGVIYGLYHGLPLSISARIGAVLASFVLESWGAQTSLPDPVALQRRYREAFGSWPIQEGLNE